MTKRRSKNKPQFSRSRKSKTKKNPRRRNKNPRKRKRKSRRRIAFRERLRVPGGGELFTVSTPDLSRGLNINYHGKSYKLSLPQLLNYFKRKNSRI